jgi:hypothetical protein
MLNICTRYGLDAALALPLGEIIGLIEDRVGARASLNVVENRKLRASDSTEYETW